MSQSPISTHPDAESVESATVSSETPTTTGCIETCDHCGQRYQIAEWPWCPHGAYGGANIPDSLPLGGQWIENLDVQPVWVESKSQLRREAAARGLRWDPAPQKGTRPPKADDDVRGRYNGGAFPTYRELHRPG